MLASGCFALGATEQHRAVGHTMDADGSESRVLGLRHLLSLLRRPRWLLGLGLVCLGAAIHIVALNLAPLAVIQPVGILAVPISVLLAARERQVRPSNRIWQAVALTVVGIVAFTVVSARAVAGETNVEPNHLLRMTLVVWAVAAVIAVVGARAPHWLRCMTWSSAGAVLYGLGSAFIKLMTVMWTNGSGPTHPVFWGSAIGLALSYAVGGWMIQTGYASGPAEIVVGSMTTVDPLVAVLFGLFVLGEGATLTPLPTLAMLVSGAMATAGVVLLSRYHPDAARRHEGKHA